VGRPARAGWHRTLLPLTKVAIKAALTSSSSGASEPPKEFFDNLLEQPEHRARIKESGISRALYLEKVVKAPNKELGDMYYDLAKKCHDDREKEKVPRSLQYPDVFQKMLNSRRDLR
jgi:ubiquinone biosynthesis protein Coq4